MFAERNGRASLEEQIGRQLSREAHHVAIRVTDRLRAELALLDDFSRQPVMREIVVLDLDKNIASGLNALRTSSPIRIGHLLVDAAGGIVAWSGDGAFAEGRLDPKQIVEAPRVIGLLEIPDLGSMLVAAVPVRDPDEPHRRLGTLHALLDWQGIVAASDTPRADSNSDLHTPILVVLGGDGKMVFPERSRSIDDRNDSLPVERWREELADGGHATDADEGWIVGRAALGEPISGWSLLVVESLSEALEPAARLRRRLFWMTGVAVALALVIAAAGAERLIGPLRELTQAIGELARPAQEGRRSVRVRSSDEIGDLARAFNDMASELDDMQRELVERERFALVGEVAAGVAHQVRTSLGVLRTSAQMLRGGESSRDDGDSEEMLSMIAAEVERLSAIVDDLLLLGHDRSLVPSRVDLREIVRSAVTFVRPRAVEGGIEVTESLPNRVVDVLCDRDAVEQVCVNLLSNAIACGDTGGRIEIRVAAEEEGRVELWVEDDGPGVPQDLAARIFDPFVTGRSGGVGLGLTFVKRIVTAHRWTIELVGNGRLGASFQIRIPPEGIEEGTG